jgi:hypothetical protein
MRFETHFSHKYNPLFINQEKKAVLETTIVTGLIASSVARGILAI